MVAKSKPAATKKKTATTEYTGTRVVYNAGEEAKDPRRVEAARKAKATLRAKYAKKAKASSAKRGTKKGGKGKKSTGEKKPRAPTAFFIFSGENRAAVRKANPKMKITEIASELGKQWRALSAEKRKAYDAKHAAAKKKLGL
jgi:hypothetical protein